MQHEIAVTSTKHSVIQYINYMEKKRKQDKHKNAQLLRNAIETTFASDAENSLKE